jgi:hypothetical protein
MKIAFSILFVIAVIISILALFSCVNILKTFVDTYIREK